MATFDFSSVERFAGRSTTIKRPREFAYFSYDDTHILHPLSTQSLSYYYPPFFNTPGTTEPLIDLSGTWQKWTHLRNECTLAICLTSRAVGQYLSLY
jgi:hypothetical protein